MYAFAERSWISIDIHTVGTREYVSRVLEFALKRPSGQMTPTRESTLVGVSALHPSQAPLSS